MVPASVKRLSWVLGLVLLGGCCYPVRHDVDLLVCGKAHCPIDPEPPQAVDATGPSAGAAEPAPPAAGASLTGVLDAEVLPAGGQKKGEDGEPVRPRVTLPERLRIPPGLPGGRAADITLPSIDAPRKQIEAAINRYFPPLPPLGADPQPVVGPQGRPLTLADLQQIARTSSPLLRQAAAEVKAAEGAALQAGAYPNPTVGYEGDTIGTG